MKQPWHRRDVDGYVREKAELRHTYPTLHFFPDDKQVTIRGGFPVTLNGSVLDRYQVEIIVPAAYPRSIPEVRETGGRIPRIADRHISTETGNACLFVEEETSVYFPPDSTLLQFLQGPVNCFFVGQLHFEEFSTWPFDERSHGWEGTVEFYSEKLGTSDLKTILAYVDCLRRPVVKGHWDCPCGAGKRLRHCHFEQVIKLRSMVSSEIAQRSFDRLKLAAAHAHGTIST